MPGTRPGMTSFTTKPYFVGCILSQTLRSCALARRLEGLPRAVSGLTDCPPPNRGNLHADFSKPGEEVSGQIVRR